MKNITNNLLVLFTVLVCLVMALVQVFAPRLVLSEFGFPVILAIILAVLALEAYLPNESDSPKLLSFLMSGLCFSLLPWSAGLTEGQEIPRLFLIGLLTYAIIAPAFRAMYRRLKTEKASLLAPPANALIFYLAAQGFVCMI